MALHVPVYLNDKPEGDNIMFDPSVADDLNPTTKVTTVTEDAKGNKKTIINENKNASDLLKQQQQEAYDREEPGRQAHKAKVEHSKYPSPHIGTSYSKGEGFQHPGFPESSNPLWSSIPSGDVFSGDITDRWAAQPTNEGASQAPYTAQTPYTPQQLAGMKQKAIDAYNEKQSKMVVFTKANGSKGKAIPGSPEAKALLAEGYVQGGQGKANQTLPSVTEDPRVVAIKDMNDRATDAGDTAYDSMTYIPTEWGGNRQAFEDARDDARVFAEKKIKKDTDLPTATDTSSVFEKDTGTFNNSLTSPEEDIAKEAVVITREDADKILAEKSNAKEKKELDAWVASIKKPGVSNSQAEMSAQALLKSLAPIKYKKPSLFKAIAIGVGTALFGGSAMDSLNAGLSSIGDDALRVDKLNAERDKQRTKYQYDAALEQIKNGNKREGPFTGKPQYVNIGTYKDPIKVSLGQHKDGTQVVRYKGKLIPVNSQQYTDWYNPEQQRVAFNDNVSRLKKEVAGKIKEMVGKQEDKKFNEGFSAQLAGGNQIREALNVYGDAGINVETGMSRSVSQAIAMIAEDFMNYKRVNPNGKKRMAEFAREHMIQADVASTGSLPDSYMRVPVDAFILPRPGSFDYKIGEMPDKAFANAQYGLNSYILTQGRMEGKESLLKMNNSQKLSLAYKAFSTVEDKETQAALEAGYTPFMWWLITKK